MLVIDDYHAIESSDVHASVAFLLDHAPPALRFVLLSRADPPFALARRRARGELVELREAELRFTRVEAADLLRRVDAGLSPGQLDVLLDRTEGWAVGLQLAGWSLAGHPDPASFVAAFSGSHRFVLDFLVEEVLDRQPPDVQEFLLETSVLDHLSSDLCDALTVRTNSQEILEQAERSGLFLIALDDSRGWWRYHHLIADLLRVQRSRDRGGSCWPGPGSRSTTAGPTKPSRYLMQLTTRRPQATPYTTISGRTPACIGPSSHTSAAMPRRPSGVPPKQEKQPLIRGPHCPSSPACTSRWCHGSGATSPKQSRRYAPASSNGGLTTRGIALPGLRTTSQRSSRLEATSTRPLRPAARFLIARPHTNARTI